MAGTCGYGAGLSDSINAGNFLTFTLAFALQLRKKARKNLSNGSWRMPVGKVYSEQSILVRS